MATFNENLRKISGEAVYGPEMRTAIVEAILQALEVDVHTISVPYPAGNNTYFQLTSLASGPDDYLLTIQNFSS